jgi:hypothetical protein
MPRRVEAEAQPSLSEQARDIVESIARDSRVAPAVAQVALRRTSKRRAAVIGAVIGGAAGAAVGAVYCQADCGGGPKRGALVFAPIGAAIGAAAGFLVALIPSPERVPSAGVVVLDRERSQATFSRREMT